MVLLKIILSAFVCVLEWLAAGWFTDGLDGLAYLAHGWQQQQMIQLHSLHTLLENISWKKWQCHEIN